MQNTNQDDHVLFSEVFFDFKKYLQYVRSGLVTV